MKLSDLSLLQFSTGIAIEKKEENPKKRSNKKNCEESESLDLRPVYVLLVKDTDCDRIEKRAVGVRIEGRFSRAKKMLVKI